MEDRQFSDPLERSEVIASAALILLLIFSLIALAMVFFGS